jgi:hypothetical protein
MSEANSQIAAAMAANDQERVDRLKDYYFGEGGLLSGIQKELSFASSNLSTMENAYSTFTDSILTKDKDGNTSFDVMKNSIIDMIYGTADEDGNRSGGYQSTMEALSTTISGLFEEGGILQTLPGQMSKGLETAIDVSGLAEASQSIVTNLPGLLSQVTTLKDLLGGEQGFITEFKAWLNNNGKDEEGNTVEDKINTNVASILSRLESPLTLIYSEENGRYELSFDTDSNDSTS